jgi:hypothetical protein
MYGWFSTTAAWLKIFDNVKALPGLPDLIRKNVNFGKFWKALGWKTLVYYEAIWYFNCYFGTYILWQSEIFVAILLVFPILFFTPRKISQP